MQKCFHSLALGALLAISGSMFSLSGCSLRSLDDLTSGQEPPGLDARAAPIDGSEDRAPVRPPDASQPVDVEPPRLDGPVVVADAAGLVPPGLDAQADLAAPAASRVLFVVGSVSLSAADGAIQKRLGDRGLDVVLANDDDLDAADTSAVALVLVSTTATSSKVGARFRTTLQPVMMSEPLLYDEMGMVDAVVGSRGATEGLREVHIEARGNPLAAGLSGTVAVTNLPATMGWGVPGDKAIVVASLVGASGQAAIFVFDKGQRMAALAAPARRVGFFLSSTSASDLTPQGWALFDAAVTWAIGR